MTNLINTVNDEEIGVNKNVYVSIPFRNIRTAPSYECIDLGEERKLLEGYLYVLSNESMPGMYKIGMTKNHPSIRAKELSRGTGVPTSFKVEAFYHVNDMSKSEAEVHEYLSKYRVNDKREFFNCLLEQIFEALQETIDYIMPQKEGGVFFARNIVCVGDEGCKRRSIKVSQECFEMLESEACDSINQLAESLIKLVLNNMTCGMSIIDGKLVVFPSSEYGGNNKETPRQYKPEIIETKPFAFNLNRSRKNA